jgi:hypothetical protein
MSPVARRIGELLVEEGACTQPAVREALRNQVIFGGRVGTNLLELEAVTEERLAGALARRHGCRHLAGAVEPEPEAVKLVAGELADRWEIVPISAGERSLTIAACDPGDLAMLDEVAFATGRRVTAVVAAEARVWALLRATYGIVRELRGIELEGHAIAMRNRADAPAAEARTAGDLMDQAGFEALYGPAQPAAPAPPAPKASIAAPRAAPPPPPDPEPSIIDLTEDMLEPAAAAPAPPPDPEATPLGFAEAMAALSGVAERTAIARIVLRYARNRVRRAVLFTVHRGLAQGWVGLGAGLSAKAPAIRLRLGTPGVLDTVVRTRSHYLGPLPRTDSNVRLLGALGGGVPKNALLVPILALGRVVNVLYADGGRGAVVDAEGVGELLILATRIAQSYDALVARV